MNEELEQMKLAKNHKSTDFIADIKQIIEHSRKQAYAAINTVMIHSYWLVGRRLVEEEQGGAARVEYGKALLKRLAAELVPLYGNTYTVRRLQDYRQFYLYFKDIEIWHSRVPNPTWTHYCELLTVSDETARHSMLRDSVRLFQTKYLTSLPTKEELANEIERQKLVFRLQQANGTFDE